MSCVYSVRKNTSYNSCAGNKGIVIPLVPVGFQTFGRIVYSVFNGFILADLGFNIFNLFEIKRACINKMVL